MAKEHATLTEKIDIAKSLEARLEVDVNESGLCRYKEAGDSDRKVADDHDIKSVLIVAGVRKELYGNLIKGSKHNRMDELENRLNKLVTNFNILCADVGQAHLKINGVEPK